MLSIQKSGKIPLSASSDIQILAEELVGVVCDQVRDKTSKFLQETSIFAKNKLEQELQSMRIPFENFNSQHKLEKYLKNDGQLLEVKEFDLGPASSNDHIYYVEISDFIKKLCSRPGFIDNILQKNAPSDEILSSYKDGAHYSDTSEVPVVDILLYYDDLECCNSLGSRAGRNGKLGLFYFQILNMADHLRSQLDNIFLLACTLTENIKKYGMNSCLRPIVDLLLKLWQTGVVIESPIFTGVIKVLECVGTESFYLKKYCPPLTFIIYP